MSTETAEAPPIEEISEEYVEPPPDPLLDLKRVPVTARSIAFHLAATIGLAVVLVLMMMPPPDQGAGAGLSAEERAELRRAAGVRYEAQERATAEERQQAKPLDEDPPEPPPGGALRVLYLEAIVHRHSELGRQAWLDRWEHEFLIETLKEDNMEVEVFLGEFKWDLGEDIRLARVDFPRAGPVLRKYDVIVNAGIPFDAFFEDSVELQVDFVKRHGGGYIMAGGRTAFGAGGYAGTPIAELVPVAMAPEDRYSEKVDVLLRATPEGKKHPITQLVSDPEKNERRWALLDDLDDYTAYTPRPAFHGYSHFGAPKEGAIVLLEGQLKGSSEKFPFLVAGQVGKGRVLAFAGATGGAWNPIWTDQWGTGQLEDLQARNRYYKRFWKNLVRWAAGARGQRASGEKLAPKEEPAAQPEAPAAPAAQPEAPAAPPKAPKAESE